MTKTSSNLKLTINGTLSNGDQFQANIRLNDECGNGHEDFSITGDIWEKGKAKIERNLICSGAIGHRLVNVSKELALFNDLHLCDFNGVPMHAVANMFYHIKNGFERSNKSNKDTFCEYYRVTPEQYDILSEAKEQDHFTALFVELPEILEKWKKQANEGIKLLEERTGLEFESKATRSNLILPDSEKLQMLKGRVNSGYYSKENSERREKERIEEKKANDIKLIREELNKKIKVETQDAEFKIALISLFGTHDNAIFYNHSNKIVFNYNEPRWATYAKKWTETEVEEFKSNSNFGVSVEIKHKY